MAEIPELGEHCAHCSTLDYLPIKCVHCNKYFCKNHRITHGCIEPDIESSDPNKTLPDDRIKCHFCNDSTQITQSSVCNACSKRFCLNHRHQADHNCEMKLNEIEKTDKNEPKMAEILAKIKGQYKQKGIKVKNRGAKNDALALKVTLMKLKSQAKGQDSTPMEEREYFYLSFVPNEICFNQENKQFDNIPVFLCREWSIGKCVDWLAKQYSLINKNNQLNQPKLVLSDESLLFDENPDKKVCCPKQNNNKFYCYSHSINELIANSVLRSAQTLILIYYDF